VRRDVLIEGKPTTDGRLVMPGAVRFPDEAIPVTAGSADRTQPNSLVGKAIDLHRDGGLVSCTIVLSQDDTPDLRTCSVTADLGDVKWARLVDDDGTETRVVRDAVLRAVHLSEGPNAWPELDPQPNSEWVEQVADAMVRKHLNRPEAPGAADDFVESAVRTTVADVVLLMQGALQVRDFDG
jgi:hypothetical protein